MSAAVGHLVGFQELACESSTQRVWEQQELPYRICRPFNCAGTGERRALGDIDTPRDNIGPAMSHVVSDLVQTVVKGQDPPQILGDGSQVRCYIQGGDLARGIVTAMFDPKPVNQDFHLSKPRSTTVLEVAELIRTKVHGDAKPFRHSSDPPFPCDVQMRVPDTTKAREVLGFEATTTMSDMLYEVIPWLREEITHGRL